MMFMTTRAGMFSPEDLFEFRVNHCSMIRARDQEKEFPATALHPLFKELASAEVVKQRSWEAHTAPDGYERVKLQDLPGRSRRPYEKKGVVTISPQAQELNGFLKTKLVKQFKSFSPPRSSAAE